MSDLLQAAMVRWLDELAAAGVFTTDASFVITSWNRWLERATGDPPPLPRLVVSSPPSLR